MYSIYIGVEGQSPSFHAFMLRSKLISVVSALLIQLIDATCSITGEPCYSGKLVGICVPLDIHGQSQDCYNTYGFLDLGHPDTCEEAYGSQFSNVQHHQILCL
jgi:hypothetical protein